MPKPLPNPRARLADDLVVLVDAYKRHDWMLTAVMKRLREEFAKLQVEINEGKSRIVDLGRGESFAFRGSIFAARAHCAGYGERSTRRSSRSDGAAA